MTAIQGLLCDVHGVLYVHPGAIEGSVAAVRRLREAGFPHLFLTNSTQFPKRHVLESLNAEGFGLESSELHTAAEAAGSLLRHAGHRRVGWLCNPALAEDVPGVEIVDPETGGDGPVDAVVVGDIGERFGYRVLNRAFRWIHEGASLVALARNRYYQTSEGLVLDSGPFVKLLEEAAQVTATEAGKPSPDFFRSGMARLGMKPGELAMVGDDLDFDIHPAMDLGLTGIQVRTGKFRADRYEAASRPADRLVADLAEAVEEILGDPSGKG